MLWESLVGAAISVVVVVGMAAGGSPADTVRKFVRLVSEHEVEVALEMLSADFEFRDPDGTFVIRRDSVRPILDWDVAVRGRAELEVLGEQPDSVTVELTETNDFLEALGVGPISHRVRYAIDGGSIRRIVLLEAARVGRLTSEAMEPVLEWARRERPEEIAPLLHDGDPVYTGESAVRWLAILEDARAAGVLGG